MNSNKTMRWCKRIMLALLLIPSSFSLPDLAQTTPSVVLNTLEQVATPQSIYFNTTFLSQYELVNRTLQEEQGFKIVEFLSTDEIPLSGLYKEVPDPKGTIIFSVGFYPGRKEGVACFTHLVPDNYNLFFFDARGHGSSQGPFVATLTQYGLHEYQDVLGALDWISENTKKPIILYGLCAGAFHTLKAHNFLRENNLLDQYQIAGVIFDSCIRSVPDAAIIPVIHIQEKMLVNFWLNWYKQDTKKTIKDRWFYKVTRYASSAILYPLHWYVRRQLMHHHEDFDVCREISHLSCPILFIHTQADTYSPFEPIQEIIAAAKKSEQLILNEGEHALLHLKYQQEYRDKLDKFLKNILYTLG